MQSKKCSNCGAVTSVENLVCTYCSSPIEDSSKLSDDSKEDLISFIFGLEKILNKVKSKNDGKVLMSFVILFFIFLGGGYYFYKNLESLFFSISLIIVWGLFTFVVFGFFVKKWEDEAMKIYFDSKLIPEINEYLSRKKIIKMDFKFTAMNELKADSELHDFISEL